MSKIRLPDVIQWLYDGHIVALYDDSGKFVIYHNCLPKQLNDDEVKDYLSKCYFVSANLASSCDCLEYWPAIFKLARYEICTCQFYKLYDAQPKMFKHISFSNKF